jgi:hypothetical protein
MASYTERADPESARVHVVIGKRYVDAFFRRLSRRYYPPHAPRTPRDGVYFLHIPKTAGSSIGRYFERSFPASEICPLWNWDDLATARPETLDQYRVFRGHFQGFLPGYLGRKLMMLTMLRDPLERTISCYSYARYNADYPFHARAMASTLREYCLHPETRWRIENYQTTCILTVLWSAGIRYDPEFETLFRPSYPLHRAIEHTTSRGVPPDVLAALAAIALKQFAAVGITEAFSQSLEKFSRVLGVPVVNDAIRANETPRRLAAAELDDATLETIRELTTADRILYDQVRERFTRDA